MLRYWLIRARHGEFWTRRKEPAAPDKQRSNNRARFANDSNAEKKAEMKAEMNKLLLL